MKFVKTLMAAALLTTAISSSVFAGGRGDQANDEFDKMGYVGFKIAPDASQSNSLEIGENEAKIIWNADKTQALDPTAGKDAGSKGIKTFLASVRDKSVAALKGEFGGDEDKTITAIVAALKTTPLQASKFTKAMFNAGSGAFKAGLDDAFAAEVVKRANPISAEERELTDAAKLGIRSKAKLTDGSEVSITDLYAGLGTDKPKTLAAVKGATVAYGGKDISLADRIAARRAKYGVGKLAGAPDDVLAQVADMIYTATQAVVHVPSKDEELGLAVVAELKKHKADLPVTVAGADAKTQAAGVVASLIKMYDKMEALDVEVTALRAGTGGGKPGDAPKAADDDLVF